MSPFFTVFYIRASLTPKFLLSFSLTPDQFFLAECNHYRKEKMLGENRHFFVLVPKLKSATETLVFDSVQKFVYFAVEFYK